MERFRRRLDTLELRYALGLEVLAVTLTVLVVSFQEVMPFASLVVPVVVGSLLLGPRTLPWFVI